MAVWDRQDKEPSKGLPTLALIDARDLRPADPESFSNLAARQTAPLQATDFGDLLIG